MRSSGELSNDPSSTDPQSDRRHAVGVDVGKRQHAAAAVTADGRDFGRIISFDHNRAGIDRLAALLLQPLGGPSAVRIGMEATGHYWMPLYFELQRRGYTSIVINPIQTRAQFRTRIRKTKTDKLDARSIARLVHSGQVKASRVPDESTLELRLLCRHRWQLVDCAGNLQRQAQALMDRIFPEYADCFSAPLLASGRALIRELGLTPAVLSGQADQVRRLVQRASRRRISPDKVEDLLARAKASIGIRLAEAVIDEQLRTFLSILERIEQQIAALDRTLEQRVQRLNSPLHSLFVGRASPILIATLHAESDPIHDFRRAGQYAAYAGLDPATRQTGQMKSTRVSISKRGSPYLRRALFLTTMGIYRRQSDLYRCYQRSRKAGRHHIDAMTIVTHKLARIIWRLLTDHRSYRSRPPKRTTPITNRR